MAYVRCDVASAGPYEYRFVGQWFPRCDVNPTGAWVACDCNESGSQVYAKTSAGERYELGARHPDNPICPRWIPGRNVFKVAWVDGLAQGRSIDIDGYGFRIPGSDGTFDASQAGSQGIRDIDEFGTIYFKDPTDVIVIEGITVLHWRERNGRIVCVLHTDWLGISVYVIPPDDTVPGAWYRAFPYDVQLLPGLAANGVVAATGEGGGFIEVADWLSRPFDPHAEVPPTEPPPTEPPPTEPPPTEPPPTEPPPTEPPPTEPPPTEPQMKTALIEVNKAWVQTYEDTHQDKDKGLGPIISVRRLSDKQALQIDQDGNVNWTTNNPGADERLIGVPGGYAAVRANKSVVFKKAGPWEAADQPAK